MRCFTKRNESLNMIALKVRRSSFSDNFSSAALHHDFDLRICSHHNYLYEAFKKIAIPQLILKHNIFHFNSLHYEFIT